MPSNPHSSLLHPVSTYRSRSICILSLEHSTLLFLPLARMPPGLAPSSVNETHVMFPVVDKILYFVTTAVPTVLPLPRYLTTHTALGHSPPLTRGRRRALALSLFRQALRLTFCLFAVPASFFRVRLRALVRRPAKCPQPHTPQHILLCCGRSSRRAGLPTPSTILPARTPL